MNTYVFTVACCMFIFAFVLFFFSALVDVEQQLISYISSKILAQTEQIYQVVDIKSNFKVIGSLNIDRYKRQALNHQGKSFGIYRKEKPFTFPFRPHSRDDATARPPVIRKKEYILPDIPKSFEAAIKFPRTKPKFAIDDSVDSQELNSKIFFFALTGILGGVLGLVSFVLMLRWYQSRFPPAPARVGYMGIYQVLPENALDVDPDNAGNNFEEVNARINLQGNNVDDRQADIAEVDQIV